jgi:hypothetical protein
MPTIFLLRSSYLEKISFWGNYLGLSCLIYTVFGFSLCFCFFSYVKKKIKNSKIYMEHFDKEYSLSIFKNKDENFF